MANARFITLEGGEGAGKSTQLRLLQQTFEAAALPHCVTREPGGSVGGEAIRKLVVEGDAGRWNPTSEALLFMAARYDHVTTLIKPALAEGKHVLCDRFYDSTYVYQGIGKSVGTQWLDGLYRQLYGNFAPDMTVYLDIAPSEGLARASARGNVAESRFESMDISFHETLRAGFLARAKAEPSRMVVVNAAASQEAVHHAIVDALTQAFSFPMKPAI